MKSKREITTPTTTNCTRYILFCLFYCILPFMEEEHVKLFSCKDTIFIFIYLFILLWWLCGLVGKSCGKKLK
jgi:cytosine/uracil/thiamine/allantoin permease